MKKVSAWAARALGVVAAVGLGMAICPAYAHQDHATAHGGDGGSERIELQFGRSAEFDYDPPEPGSYRLPAIKPAADGFVVDASGRRLALHEVMDGRITVLSFIYTRCADPRGCPAAIGLLHGIEYVSVTDPEIGDNVALLSLSFDPDHDTPAVMAEFAASHGPREHDTGAEWRFLTTASAAELSPILEAYGQPIGRKADTADPFGPYYHQIKVFLIDRRGMIRNVYSLGFLDPRLVVTDIRTLLQEERAAEAAR